jgi:uncharacterized membrane protein
MSQLLPPPMPPHLTGDNPLHRAQFRLWQIVTSTVTVVATVWFFTFNPIAGILAVIVAKHILVAILASGLTRYPTVPPAEGAGFPESNG